MGFTTEQEDELWIRWRRGESSRLTGRALRCHPSSARAFLSPRSSGDVLARAQALGATTEEVTAKHTLQAIAA